MYNDIREPITYKEIKPGIYVYWEVFSSNKSINFLYKYNFRGWFALGLSPTMFNSDIHIVNAISNNTAIQLLDTFSNANSRPSTDK